MHHDTYAPDELSKTTIARATFWLSLLGMVPLLPLFFMRHAPDWVVVSVLCIAVPSAVAAIASGVEYLVRKRPQSTRAVADGSM